MDSAILSAFQTAAPVPPNSAPALGHAPHAALPPLSPAQGPLPRESALTPLPSPASGQTPASPDTPLLPPDFRFAAGISGKTVARSWSCARQAHLLATSPRRSPLAAAASLAANHLPIPARKT